MRILTFIGVGCAMLMSLAAFAGADDALVVFSSLGPDKYADGSVVKDGENYALVWVKAGSSFGGFTAEGALVNEADNLLLGVFPRASQGRCAETYVQIDRTFADAYAAAGSFKLYVLDTRSADKSSVAKGADELEKGVQSYGEVATMEVASGTIKVTSASAASEATLASAIPSGVLPPVIKGAEVRNGAFVVTVEQTSPSLRYNLAVGDTPAADGKVAVAEAPKAGDAKQMIELKYPIKDGEAAKFFKVVRDPIVK